MIGHPELLAIFGVALFGAVVVWANPHRLVNRLFFSSALHVAGWMLCVHAAAVSSMDPAWVRVACLVGAWIPVHLWFLKEASIGQKVFWGRVPGRRNGWMVCAAVISVLVVIPGFAGSGEGGGLKLGIPYAVFMVGFAAMLVILCRETVRDIRAQTGVVRIELQLLLFGGTAVALGVVMVMAMYASLRDIWPIRVMPLIVFSFYSVTGLAITMHRVFDVRQLVMVLLQKALLVAIAAIAAVAIDTALGALGSPHLLSLVVTVAFVVWLVTRTGRRLDRLFQFYRDPIAVREAAYSAARETRPEKLTQAFSALLKGWGRSEHVFVFYTARNDDAGMAARDPKLAWIIQTMRTLRWVTPERVARQRVDPMREQLGAFLAEKELGVLTIAEGPSMTVLIGVGVSASRLPFTYPAVLQLMELASIIEGAFERVHFSTKAQHAEQLATVGLLGASMAHEIRNPLVTIKTFVQLLPTHYQDGAFREKFFRLIAEEVNRIDRLTEQLLDLAAPRAYLAKHVELHPVLRSTVELVATKAAHKNVELVTDFGATPDIVHTDPAAAKQVMLNLCFNALQALEAKAEGERRVSVSTRNTDRGVEVAVADTGAGVAQEMLPRLFQPFQTTKSSGFGLGLAICCDILTNLNASISVDQPAPGRGATFRVTFPTRASSPSARRASVR